MLNSYVLAGFELKLNAEPIRINDVVGGGGGGGRVGGEEEREKDGTEGEVGGAEMLDATTRIHLTSCTLVVPSLPATIKPHVCTVRAHVEAEKVIVLAAFNTHSTTLTLPIDYWFHSDSEPLFDVISDLKGKESEKLSVALSGYVEESIDLDSFDYEDENGNPINPEKIEGDEDEEDGEENEESVRRIIGKLKKSRKRDPSDDEEEEEEDEEISSSFDEDDEEEGKGEEGEGEGEREDEDEDEDEDEEEDEEESTTSPPPSKQQRLSMDTKQTPATTKAKGTPAKISGKTEPVTKVPATPASAPAKSLSTTTTNNANKSSNKSTNQAQKLPSGLTIEDVKVGNPGKEANKGSQVSIRYKGELMNGKVFDSNMPKGKPLQFKCGAGDVIAGFDEGIKGMRAGGTRILIIPPHLAYGKKGEEGIPPNSTLKFTVELLKTS